MSSVIISPRMVGLILVLISLHVRTSVSQSSYCSLSLSHIMCKYREGVSYNCGSYYYRGLTDQEKKEIVDEHNRLRSRLAMGYTGHPTAANMQELQWDEELAILAQRHADQCRFVHDCSDCRKVSRFRVGQNLLRDKSISAQSPDWRFSIQSWFREIENYPNIDNSARYRYVAGTGHFVQMSWAATALVGCGYITYRNAETEPRIARYYVCHYGPVGNYIGQQIYQPGSPCSSCPRGTACSGSYAGLCRSSYGSQGNFTVTRNTGDVTNNRVARLFSSNTEYIQQRTYDTENVPQRAYNTGIVPKTSLKRKENTPQSKYYTEDKPQRNYYSSAGRKYAPTTKQTATSRQQNYSGQRPGPCTNIVCTIINIFT